jgi:hypothetical protein
MPIDSKDIAFCNLFNGSTGSRFNEYVRQMEDELLDNNTELWFTGWLSQFIDENRSVKSIAESKKYRFVII